MRQYRVLLPLVVHTEDGEYKQGETFEKEFTAQDEYENLQSGLLELVPSKYKVVGESRVYGTDPGEEFEAGIPMELEAGLISGGNIERVEPPTPAERKTTTRKKGGKP